VKLDAGTNVYKFLGAFAKELRMRVNDSSCTEQSESHQTDFPEITYFWVFFFYEDLHTHFSFVIIEIT